MNDASARSWKLERDAEGIAWLTFDKPGTSANVLSAGVLMELDEVLGALEQDRPRGVIVVSAKKSGFIAGADIKEFIGLKDEASGYQLIRRGQQVLNRLAALSFPTVAAIHGFALGGGLELALACRYRVAVGDERLSLGLPEVLLGIHPGFGGTVRAVQVAGVRVAMEMMLTGKPLRAEKARAAGLIDRDESEWCAVSGVRARDASAGRRDLGNRGSPRGSWPRPARHGRAGSGHPARRARR